MKNLKKITVAALLLSFAMAPSWAGATYSNSTTEGKVNSITLSGSGESVKWVTNGYSDNGFKVVWSKKSGPTYPLRSSDRYHYFSEPEKSSDSLNAFDGAGVYYVRVCEYLGGVCGTYSNQITLNLGGNSNDEGVTYIKLKGDGKNITWDVGGYSPQGFKVVWSRTQTPVYPSRNSIDRYHYFNDPTKRSDTIDAFDGHGVYYVRVCEYTGGGCNLYSNEIQVALESEIACTMEYAPVCTVNGRTYANECVATKQYGEEIAYKSECKKDAAVIEIEEKAELLVQNKLSQILDELNQLRSLVKEQQTQIKYLRSLFAGMGNITASAQNAINSFISYGVDENTKDLGEGERAAVMYSYKKAYNKMPTTEEELTDAVKIANGRWPSAGNEEAENRAKEMFEKIYKRPANVTDNNDLAAIKIMAYGLRQKAENRNLNSEKKGIKTFKNIFGRVPSSTEDWNIMQAITYSGAAR